MNARRFWHTGFVALTSVAGILASACSLGLNKESSATFVRNQCTASSDCGKGTCHNGVCVAYNGALSTLLLAVTPPLAAVGVGGVRFLQIATSLEQSGDDTKIDLSPTTVVHGFVLAPKSCGGSVPVQVTLTPREEGYGLPAVTYVAKAAVITDLKTNDACYSRLKDSPDPIYEFVLSVPVTTNTPLKCGSGGDNKACYDVYVEPLSAASHASSASDAGVAADDCAFVPHYLPNYAVDACFAINPTPPQHLRVVIPWPSSAAGASSLDGWTVDVVHPLSGHVLSNPVILPTRKDPATNYDVDVRYAPVPVTDDDTQGKELIRLTPPSGVVAPVIQAELSALQATDIKTATFPEFGPFPAAVQLDSWVWESADSPSPVPGTVELTATKDGDRPALDGVKPGIFASFSTTVTVTKDGGPDDGRLLAVVPPGHYRARMTPQSGLHRSAVESTFEVACDHDPTYPARCAPADPTHPPTSRAANVLVVPPAASISGQLVPAVPGVSVGDAIAYAQPAIAKSRECPVGVDAGTCAAAPLGVLELSLGEDAFVPRAASAPVLGGRFVLQDVDCGSCSKLVDGGHTLAGGATFDLSVRPPDGSRLPWFTERGVYVSASVALGELPLSLPIVHRGVVEIPQKDQGPLTVPRALIQAYAMWDDTGAIIKNPAGFSSCASSLTTPSAKSGARCIRSVLKVAETQSAEDGTFELVLPSEVQ